MYEFLTCKFPYLLKCIYNSKINTQSNFKVVHRHAEGGTTFESSPTHVPTEAKQDDVLPSCLGCNSFFLSVLFCGPFSTTVFFSFLCFWLVISLHRIASSGSAEVLCSVS
jgi:hypothetical protein